MRRRELASLAPARHNGRPVRLMPERRQSSRLDGGGSCAWMRIKKIADAPPLARRRLILSAAVAISFVVPKKRRSICSAAFLVVVFLCVCFKLYRIYDAPSMSRLTVVFVIVLAFAIRRNVADVLSPTRTPFTCMYVFKSAMFADVTESFGFLILNARVSPSTKSQSIFKFSVVLVVSIVFHPLKLNESRLSCSLGDCQAVVRRRRC